MNRGSREQSVESSIMAEIKVMKKQALRSAPKLTNVYTGLFIFLPTMFIWEEKSKI